MPAREDLPATLAPEDALCQTGSATRADGSPTFCNPVAEEDFTHGDPQAEVPDFFGVGLMSDGDQTRSVSSAEFAEFVLR